MGWRCRLCDELLKPGWISILLRIQQGLGKICHLNEMFMKIKLFLLYQTKTRGDKGCESVNKNACCAKQLTKLY